MSGKGNADYEKFDREFGEKHAELLERMIQRRPMENVWNTFMAPARTIEFPPPLPAGVERADDNERGGE
jgi:hypothetical protein